MPFGLLPFAFCLLPCSIRRVTALVLLGAEALVVLALVLFLFRLRPTFGLAPAAISVWGLVEGILYLTSKTGSYSVDSTGRPLRS